ncbi:MAG: ATP-grasp domain-containing protein [Dermatophilaceae bacterium]
MSAAYLRPYDAYRVPAVADATPRGPAVRHAHSITSAVWDWAQTTSATVINRPRAAATNSSKPLQARLMEDAGLRTPESLITNDRTALSEFLAAHGAVVYKSTSGVRATVSLVNRDDRDRWDRLATCPTYFQRYLDGDDVRVHVVGDRIFASRVHTAAVDYRRPGDATVDIAVTCLPADVAAGCVRVNAALGLLVSGIDLRHTSDGSWYAFEVNPSPAFTYYPQDDEVAVAVADLLERRGPDHADLPRIGPAG